MLRNLPNIYSPIINQLRINLSLLKGNVSGVPGDIVYWKYEPLTHISVIEGRVDIVWA
jgi:hypothetical protein